MCLTKEEPRPRSSRLNELIKILSTIQVPNSCTSKRVRMYGVSSSPRRKLHDRPRRLKKVFVTSFFENSPSRVTGFKYGAELVPLSSLIGGQRGPTTRPSLFI